jgi:hypothetical protein
LTGANKACFCNDSPLIEPATICNFLHGYSFPPRNFIVVAALRFANNGNEPTWKDEASMKYMIKSGYQVFEWGTVEPIREANQQQLFGWLRNCGLSRPQATAVIREVDSKGAVDLDLPKTLRTPENSVVCFE